MIDPTVATTAAAQSHAFGWFLGVVVLIAAVATLFNLRIRIR